MTRTSPPWITLGTIALVTAGGLLGACQSAGAEPAPPRDQEETSAADEETGSGAAVEVVPGFAPGEFPEIAMFEIPDLSMLDESRALMAIEVDRIMGDYPGLIVSPARCDEAGVYSGSGRTIVTDGEGGGSSQDGAESRQNDGEGSGTWSEGAGSIVNDGDGSGSSSDGAVTITNSGDGSGTYAAGAITMSNDGEGTVLVNGAVVEADPLPPLPPAGEFPSMEALEPVDSCGVTITLEDGVLFDFDRSELRPEADEVLAEVADAMGGIDASRAEVSGHTDGKGSHSYNQTLSEERARAVAAALTAAGVGADLEAVGCGETRPVAPNDVDGADNPAGRQLNRRVEIFVPQG